MYKRKAKKKYKWGVRSKGEEALFAKLKKIFKRKARYEQERIPYTLHCKYTPDFTCDGSSVYIEYKGRFTSQDRRKMRAVKDQYPSMDLRIIFERDQPLYSGSKTKYSQWAEKHGFKYAIGTIPDEWIEEIKNG